MRRNILSDRAKGFRLPGNFGASARATAAAATGAEILRLTVGQPHLPPPPHVVEAFVEASRAATGHTYPPVGGLRPLRELVAARSAVEFARPVSADEVLITVGTKGAVATALEVLLDPGDEVLLAAPHWSGFTPAIERVGGVPVIARDLTRRDGLLTAEDVARFGTDRTRVVILNSPANPTGAMIGESQLRELEHAIAALPVCVAILSDEIYGESTFAPGTHVPTARMVRAVPVVTVSGWSKSYALPGDRLGYAVGPSEVIAAMEALQGITAYPGRAAQHAALVAARDGGAYPRSLAGLYAANWEHLRARLPELAEIGLNLLAEPRAGFFAFFDASALAANLGGESGEAAGDCVERWLLANARVAVSSGESFGDPEAIRISLSIGADDFRRAIGSVLAAVRGRTHGQC